MTGNAATNGDNLRTAYTNAKAHLPNGFPRSPSIG